MKVHKIGGRAIWLLSFAAGILLIGADAHAAVDKSIIKSQEGTAALLRGRFDLAIQAYDDALKDPDLPGARQAALYSDRGVAKWRLKQLDGALADFSKAIFLNPDYAAAYNNRGNVFLDMDRPEEAFKDFDKAVTLSTSFGAAYCNRGNANQKLKRLEAAESDFKKAVEIMPSSAVPYNGRGKAAGELGRHFTALRYLNRAITLNGQYAPAYENRAAIYMLFKRNDDAIQDLDKVIALAPDRAELYVYRGRAYARDKRSNQASRDFAKALELAPENAAALVGRASQNIERKRADLALEDLNKAIAIDPKLAEAYLWRGQARNSLGDVEGGDQDLSKVIELDPVNAEAYRVRGSFRERAGQAETALADYRKALELDPLLREARDAYKTASGDTADSVVKPIAPNVDGWDIYRTATGSFVALNDRYPKIPVPLEMIGDGNAAILEWTPLREGLSGIGLLRYRAGERKGNVFESVAIIDLSRGQVLSIEPYLIGEAKSKWDWAQTAVTVTDHEGLVSYYELKKPRLADSRASDDPFSLFSSRQNSRSAGRRPSLFGWLFR